MLITHKKNPFKLFSSHTNAKTLVIPDKHKANL